MLKRLPHLALVVLGLGVLAGSLLQADTPPDTKKIAQLVEKLGSGDFDEREQATEALDKIGIEALEALRKATKSDDAEMRRRAADLVGKIEKREASALLLRPTRVTLSLKDATVTEALAALRKAGDATFQVNDPANTLKDVRITLELKDATYFEALAAVCEKAGLVEGYANQGQGVIGFPGGPPPLPVQPIRPIKRPPQIQPVPPQRVPDLPPPPERPEGFAFQAEEPARKPVPPRAAVPPPAADVVPAQPPVQIQQIQIGGGGPGIVIGGPGMPFMPGMPNTSGTIVLSPGKGAKLPADTSSAYRIRAVPSHFRMAAPGQSILNTMLEITPEPRLRWAGHESVTITQAIDDQDQKIAQFDPNAAQPGPGGGGVGIAFPGGVVGGFPGQMAGNATIPLYLKGGAKATKTLKELSGTIAARVYVPHSDPVVVEKVMDAPGKSVKGEKGGAIKIVEVTREAEAVRIKFELVPAKDAAGGAGENQNGPFPGGFPVPQPGILLPPMGGIGVAPAILPVAPPQPAPQPDRPAPKPERRAPQAEGPGFAFQAQVAPAQAQAQIQIQAAPIQVQIQPLPAIAPAPVWIGGGGGMMGQLPDGIKVLDEKGNSLPIVGLQQNFIGNPAGQLIRVWEVRVMQLKDQPKVDKLTWQQMKTASVDIPFTLKDVPVQ